jgi:hypothetical protein
MSEIVGEENDFMEKLNGLKDEYYATHSKNTFFKKSQKMDCAKYISDSIDLDTLIDNTIYVVPNTNTIYIDYTVFKLYATPENYDKIIDHIMNTFKYIINYYSTYEVYINLDSFTVSSAERYKDIIRSFCDKCLNDSTNFGELLSKFHILNTPSVMELIIKIFKPFVDPIVINKIQFHKKEESAEIIKTMQK